MNTFTGFIFTKWPLEDLHERGFRFQAGPHSLEDGYLTFSVLFPDQSSFQIREVLEEQLYKKANQIERFEPSLLPLSIAVDPLSQSNSLLGVKEAIGENHFEDCDLMTYLKIRKPFPLWALWMECENFEQFCKVAKPDRIFTWKGQEVALVHLGPNCFDFIVTQKAS